MNESRLTFYTNMPTPYQLDFFDALSERFQLSVVYFSAIENDRQWKLSAESSKYFVRVLKNNLIARIVQKRISSFHFSNSIFSVLSKDNNKNIIVNGTYWSPNVIIALLISRLYRKKVFFYGEAVFPVKSKLKYVVKKMLLLPVLVFTDGIFAVGSKAVSSYKNYGYRKTIYNIPYNINTDLFEDFHIRQDKLREMKTAFSCDHQLVFLTSGSLIARKGMDLVIEAFLKLDQSRCCLIILGDGPEKDRLIQLAGNSFNIHFEGFVEKEEIPYYFKLSDIFVFASWYDGWAVVINEAIAAGLAIICSTEVGAASDKLRHGSSVILCKPGNTLEFTDAMKLLMESPTELNSYKEQSYKNKEKVSSSYNAKLMYDILRVD